MSNEECGIRNGESAFSLIPHLPSFIPHSKFHISNSSFYIPQGAGDGWATRSDGSSWLLRYGASSGWILLRSSA